jgi:hypothetical protein
MDQDHGPDQVTAKVEQPAYVKCSCCGELIENSADKNACFGIEPYPHDDGFGECFECGGDPHSDDILVRLGWMGRTFYEARMDIVRECLSPENRTKFDAMDYERQIAFIGRCIEKGLMI